jgi:Protein of unknown function (DUF664)
MPGRCRRRCPARPCSTCTGRRSRANAFIAAMSLDSGPASWPEEIFPNWRMTDVREAIVHVITETACHAGHLDAVRELIDGRSWLVLT